MDDELESDNPADALLAQEAPGHRQDQLVLPAMTRLGTLRAYWLGCVVCIGGFLFGYDSGIVGCRTSLLLLRVFTDMSSRRGVDTQVIHELVRLYSQRSHTTYFACQLFATTWSFRGMLHHLANHS